MHNSDNEHKKTSKNLMEEQADDGLSALWQAQPVTTINIEEVKANLSSERTKQRWYMVIDALMLVPGVYVFMKYWDNMTYVSHMIIVFMLITTSPFLIYQLWLRRVAAFYKNTQTADHLARLTKQIKNNVKIAWMTKHSTWLGMIFGAVIALERYFFGELTPEIVMKMAIVMTSMSVVMLVWYVWASKRQKRFERQLETLEKMAQQR